MRKICQSKQTKEQLVTHKVDGPLKAYRVSIGYTCLGYITYRNSINNTLVASFSKRITFVRGKLGETIMPIKH